MVTSQLGPHQVVAALSAEFQDNLTTQQIEACIERLERAVREKTPDVVALFVKPQTPDTWARQTTQVGATR